MACIIWLLVSTKQRWNCSHRNTSGITKAFGKHVLDLKKTQQEYPYLYRAGGKPHSPCVAGVFKCSFLEVATISSGKEPSGGKDLLFMNKQNNNSTLLHLPPLYFRDHTGLAAPESDLANSLDIATKYGV